MKIYHSIISLLIGFGCLIAFYLSDSKINENGIIEEPFALLPIGYLFVLLGIVYGVILIIKHYKKKH